MVTTTTSEPITFCSVPASLILAGFSSFKCFKSLREELNFSRPAWIGPVNIDIVTITAMISCDLFKLYSFHAVRTKVSQKNYCKLLAG